MRLGFALFRRLPRTLLKFGVFCWVRFLSCWTCLLALKAFSVAQITISQICSRFLSASSLDRKYTYRADHDPVSGKYIHKITFSQNFSDDVSCIMFDAVNNLRASLDQMTYAVAMRHNPGRDAESLRSLPLRR